MEDKDVLKQVGLTDSEVKVYLALLKIRTFASKSKIVDESKIASSKVYEILHKLIDKGLVSTIIKNNVQYFTAATPRRLKDFIQDKKDKIIEQEKAVDNILPRLEEQYKELSNSTHAEIFFGWKGLETIYSELIRLTKKNEEILILGASTGTNNEKTRKFFSKYTIKANLKKIRVRILFNDNSKEYVHDMERESRIKFNRKFLNKTTPVEIVITKSSSVIVILKEEPIAINITDNATAKSFQVYFEELWKIGKK